MRAVLLTDVPRDDRTTTRACAVVGELLAARGAAVAVHDATMLDIGACVGCFDCWAATPGRCRFRDDGDRLVRAVVNAELLVLLGPVTFGGYAARLKRAVDRLLPALSPMLRRRDGEVHRRARYRRMPRLLAVGTQVLPEEEPARLFRTVVERNALHLYAPAWGVALLDATMTDAGVRAGLEAALDAADCPAAPTESRRGRTTAPLVVVRA